MGLRLTVILLAAIFLIMRFGSGPIPESPAPEVVIAPEQEADAPAAPETAQAQRASETQAVIRREPVPEAPARIILEPPAALQPVVEETAETTPVVLDGFGNPSDTLISPEEALPEGFANGGALGLGGALDLRDQVSAALDEAQDDIPARPSLADLARPGGGQPARPETVEEPVPAAAPAAPAPDGPLASVTASSVNLRGGPSTLNAVVGRVTNGEVLELRGEFSGGWAAVGHPDTGETVYISSQFLDPLDN